MMELTYKPVSIDDLSFWTSLYCDPAVQKQMLATVISIERLIARGSRTVFDKDGNRVGGFSLERITDTIGTFGIVIAKEYRGMGLGKKVIDLIEHEARIRGFLTLRADVFLDNPASLQLLTKAGYRPFIQLERNV